MENLKEKTARGLLWGAVNNGTMQVLNLLIGILLSRRLSPEEYGIVGVLSIFTIIAGNLQSAGFTQALINVKQPTARDYNSVFWFNILMGFACYAVLFCCAPLIARFFGQPLLTGVSRVVFLAFLISSFGIVQNAYLIKNMMNREIAVSNLVALTVSGVAALLMAYNGYSYWSLAWQQIIYISVLNVLRFYYSSWRPSLTIDTEPVKRMVPFSVKILLTNIINTLNQQLLTFIFGRMYTAGASVGNYTQASKWSQMGGTTISGMLQQVAQTVLVSVVDEQERELRVFRKMVRFASLVAFPAMLGLALVAEEFIFVTVGPKWAECIPLLRILCIGGAFLPLHTLFQNLLISSGRSDLYLRLNVVQMVLQVVVVLLFSRQGILAMVACSTLLNVLWIFVWLPFAGRLIGLRLRHLLSDTVPFLLSALLTMGVTFYLTQAITNLWLLLLARIVVAALVYAAMMYVCGAEIFRECLAFISRRSRK